MDSGGERPGSLTSRLDSDRPELPEPQPPAGPAPGSSWDDEGCRDGGWKMTEGRAVAARGPPGGSPGARPESRRVPNGLALGAKPEARWDGSARALAEPAEAPATPGSSSPDSELPIMNWEALENHIAGLQLQEMEKQSRERCRSPTVAASQSPLGRRKMDGAQRLTSWERTNSSSWQTMGNTFSCTSRFHSRMNLQLCFINDSSSESDTEEPVRRAAATPSPRAAPGEVPPAEGDLLSRKKELEREAKRGLALVKRRIELEKQKQLTRAASDWSGDAWWRGRGLEPSVLGEMTVTQLQSLQANVFSQIHRLNTQLMELLETRDDLKTEQDAMLVEIGDLTH